MGRMGRPGTPLVVLLVIVFLAGMHAGAALEDPLTPPPTPTPQQAIVPSPPATLPPAATLRLATPPRRKLYSEETQAITVTEEEKEKIDRWITEHGLNKYGDPKNSGYFGGTPLYDEVTGETITKYQYIVYKHPDKPWE